MKFFVAIGWASNMKGLNDYNLQALTEGLQDNEYSL